VNVIVTIGVNVDLPVSARVVVYVEVDVAVDVL